MASVLRLALTYLGLIALKGSLQDLQIYDDPAVAPHHCEAFEFEVSVPAAAGYWPQSAERLTVRRCSGFAPPRRAEPHRTLGVCFFHAISSQLIPTPAEVAAWLAFACRPIAIHYAYLGS